MLPTFQLRPELLVLYTAPVDVVISAEPAHTPFSPRQPPKTTPRLLILMLLNSTRVLPNPISGEECMDHVGSSCICDCAFSGSMWTSCVPGPVAKMVEGSPGSLGDRGIRSHDLPASCSVENSR